MTIEDERLNTLTELERKAVEHYVEGHVFLAQIAPLESRDFPLTSEELRQSILEQALQKVQQCVKIYQDEIKKGPGAGGGLTR